MAEAAKASSKYELPFTPFLTKESESKIASIYGSLKYMNADHILYHRGKDSIILFESDPGFQKLQIERQEALKLIESTKLTYYDARGRGLPKKELDSLQENIYHATGDLDSIDKQILTHKTYLRIKGFSEYTRSEINDQMMKLLPKKEQEAVRVGELGKQNPKNTLLSPEERKELMGEMERSIVNTLTTSKELLKRDHKADPESSEKGFKSIQEMAKTDRFYDKYVAKALLDPTTSPDEKETIIKGYSSGGHILNAAYQLKETLNKSPIFQRLVVRVAEKAIQQLKEDSRTH